MGLLARSGPPNSTVGRFLPVAWTAARVYLGYKYLQRRRRRLGFEATEPAFQRHHQRSARWFYETAVHLRGLLIKTGQFVGARADVVPEPYVVTLSHLQDRVPPRSFAEMRHVVERELGRPLKLVFREFDERPVASASLAQVHRAVLHDGREVAVKVQYPEIAEVVRRDLRSLKILVDLLQRFEPAFDYRVLYDELAYHAPIELDFVHEGQNAERVARELRGREDVYVPRIHWDYTTRRVLVMEYVHGLRLTDVDGMRARGIDPRRVAQTLIEAYCDQILVNGFFHADPHPGNLFVQEGPRVVFVDFGLAKEVPRSFRRGLVDLTRAILEQDFDAAARAFHDLGFRTRSGDPRTFVAVGKAYLHSLEEMSRRGNQREIVVEINQQLAEIVRANPVVRVPGDIVLVGRVMGLLSGLGKTLDSRVDLVRTLVPYVAEQAAREHGFDAEVARTLRAATEARLVQLEGEGAARGPK